MLTFVSQEDTPDPRTGKQRPKRRRCQFEGCQKKTQIMCGHPKCRATCRTASNGIDFYGSFWSFGAQPSPPWGSILLKRSNRHQWTSTNPAAPAAIDTNANQKKNHPHSLQNTVTTTMTSESGSSASSNSDDYDDEGGDTAAIVGGGDTRESSSKSTTHQDNNQKQSVPGEGYVCKLCGIPGHWIQQCTNKPQEKRSKRSKKKKNKRKRNSEEEGEGGDEEGEESTSYNDTTTTTTTLKSNYRPGIDPSPKDIQEAKDMQKIKPPNCDCGIPGRLKKVKKSKVSEGSRANGVYFFFCSKKKDDSTKCNFVVPVNEISKTNKEKNQSNFFAKKRKGIINK